MRSMGLKSLFWAVLFGALAIGLLYTGIFNRHFLSQTDARLAFGIGFFATLFSGIVFRAFRLEETSGSALHYCPPTTSPIGTILVSYKNHSLCLTRDQPGEVYEFSPTAKRALVFLFFLGLGFSTFQFRELHAVLTVEDRHYLGKPHYCKIENLKQDVQKEVRPECRLIMRAFELGYVKDLGECGQVNDDTKPVVCELQHPDEPNLHFAQRLIVRQWNYITKGMGEKNFETQKEEFQKDIDNFQPMVEMLMADINNDPTSAHLIFTTLPNPKSGFSQQMDRLFRKSHCVRWYQRMPNSPPSEEGQAQASNYLEHSMGHLLYDSSYPNTSAPCDEYETLWGIEQDLCKKLESAPEDALASSKLAGAFDAVLNYYQRKSTVRPNLKFKKPGEFLSINCFTYGEAKTQLVAKTVEYKGHKIPFRWMKLGAVAGDISPHISILKSSAKLMAPDFDYGAFQSQASVQTGDLSVGEDLLQIDNYRLSRLGFLRDADVFLGSAWVERRADIIEVYPFYLHMRHFVNTFRDRYSKARGRVQ